MWSIMSDFESQIRYLRERTESNRRDFLRAELQTCFLAVERGNFEISLGNRHEAEKEFAAARRGAQVIEKLLREAPAEIPEIQPRFLELKASIESFRADIDAY
jgi:hypothetical protein